MGLGSEVCKAAPFKKYTSPLGRSSRRSLATHPLPRCWLNAIWPFVDWFVLNLDTALMRNGVTPMMERLYCTLKMCNPSLIMNASCCVSWLLPFLIANGSSLEVPLVKILPLLARFVVCLDSLDLVAASSLCYYVSSLPCKYLWGLMLDAD